MSPSSLPEWMPIVASRMEGRAFPERYVEEEITGPVDLCDSDGRLNPAVRGWARRPIVRANLSGHWPHKKRWNFWNWISPRFVFSVTLADIDYAAFCAFFFIDFESGKRVESLSPAWPHSFAMPEHVERPITFRSRSMEYENRNDGDDGTVHFSGRSRDGTRVRAELLARKPDVQESLTVVVPWTRERFQLNTKENGRPCEGTITIGDRRYEVNPDDTHAVQDFGRGIWPYRSFWNWGVGTGTQDGRRIGINVGGKWTTGTGANENALFVDGRLDKIMEDLVWEYDIHEPMQSWRVRSHHSDVVDLRFDPVVEHRSDLTVGILATRGTCVFGRWTGTVRAHDEWIRISDLPGWAEEFIHRW